MTGPGSGLVPVYVARPGSGLVAGGVDWPGQGLDPRWSGMETGDCVAALDPGVDDGQAAGELERFLAGARSRGEPALVVATIGAAPGDAPRPVLSTFDVSVGLPGDTAVRGRRLPAGMRPRIAPGLAGPDRELGTRLLARPVDAPWWALKLAGATADPGGGGPSGLLHPLLVDALGDPVAAVWTSPDGDQRWYLVPAPVDGGSVLEWLVGHAVPAYVPDALRRLRSPAPAPAPADAPADVPTDADAERETAAEAAARRALAEMEQRHADERARLEGELSEARAVADTVRHGLLHGTGAEMVEAVSIVLASAGFVTNPHDEPAEPGASSLLAALGGQRRLVEVPPAGGVLVVDRRPALPRERDDASPVPAVAVGALFDWWRVGDWGSIRAAVLGDDAEVGEPVPPPAAEEQPARRRSWRWGRGD